MRIAPATAAVLAAAAGFAGTAAANPTLSPIQSRNYQLDVWSPLPFGDPVAMGGATVARAIGSEGALDNPAAPAIRKDTDGTWSLDYHVEYSNASLSSDYANTGIAYGALGISDRPSQTTQLLSIGGAARIHDWGFALGATARTTNLGAANGTGGDVYAESLLVKGSLAYFIPSADLAIGGAAEAEVFAVQTGCTGCSTAFTVSGWGAELGATWVPYRWNLRVGVVASTGISGSTAGGPCAATANCDGLTLPEGVVVPAVATAGAAYRFAPSTWNQHVTTPFRDERAVTLAFDVVTSMPVHHAYGLDAFAIGYLERADAHTEVSPRAGVEWEMVPGRFRLRGGSYWEPSRFDGVDGRVHGTFGLELRVFEVNAWGPRRGRITLAGDLARGYANLGISVGLWH